MYIIKISDINNLKYNGKEMVRHTLPLLVSFNLFINSTEKSY